MIHIAKSIYLSKQEIQDAKDYGLTVIIKDETQDNGLIGVRIESTKFFPLFKFLRNIRDFSDYSDDQIVEYYISEIKDWEREGK